MKVRIATREDIPSWLELAAEVEHLFGPHVDDPGFLAALRRSVDRGSAFCIREGDGPTGAPLLAGMLFSAKVPIYRVSWLAVTGRWRHRGLGSLLMAHALEWVQPPAEVSAITFGADFPGGVPARRFYESFGFEPAEMAEDGPEGGSRQVFRKIVR
jgi:GNAT superfamily N-acetyltransferase